MFWESRGAIVGWNKGANLDVRTKRVDNICARADRAARGFPDEKNKLPNQVTDGLRISRAITTIPMKAMKACCMLCFQR